MSITTLANYPDAVVGLLGFGAFFLAVIAIFRDYFTAFSPRAIGIPTPIPPYIPTKFDNIQRLLSLWILAVVCLALSSIFIYIITNNLVCFRFGFICLFISTVVVTILAITMYSVVSNRSRTDMKKTERVEMKVEELFQEDLKELQKEETE